MVVSSIRYGAVVRSRNRPRGHILASLLCKHCAKRDEHTHTSIGSYCASVADIHTQASNCLVQAADIHTHAKRQCITLLALPFRLVIMQLPCYCVWRYTNRKCTHLDNYIHCTSTQCACKWSWPEGDANKLN